MEQPAIDIARIILGCGNFGGVGSDPALRGRGETESQAREILNEARRRGIFQFDTANTYGGGASEEILGRWIKSQNKDFRETVQIATKVGNAFGARAGERPLSRAQISHHLDQSLRRLGVAQIAVYYIHEPDADTPLDESLEAFERALTAGKIASLGLSNVNKIYVNRILKAGGERLRRKIRYVQNGFNYLDRADSADLIPFLQEREMAYVAFAPLAGGLLTGKYQLQGLPPTGSRVDVRPEPYRKFLNPKAFATIQAFVDDARARHIQVSEAALRFVLSTAGIQSTIIGPRRKEHFENLGLECQ